MRVPIALVLLLLTGRASAIESEALRRLAPAFQSKAFTLRVDLHEPDPKSASIHAPTLGPEGWLHVNQEGPVLFHAGSLVEVTGIFNYAERGFFLEIAEVTRNGDSPASRKRLRIRFMIHPGVTGLEEQRAMAVELIEKVLMPVEP